MYVLGLESSCDETSAAIVRMDTDENGVCTREICANMIASQIETHRLYGGVVPEIAGRAHIEAISRITYQALEEAGITVCELGGVAVHQRAHNALGEVNEHTGYFAGAVG